MSVISIAYISAALAYLSFALLLLAARRFAWPFNYLLSTAALMVVWAVSMAWSDGHDMTFQLLIVLDALHAFAALLFLGQLIQRSEGGAWRRVFALAPWSIPLIAAFLYWASSREQLLGFQVAFYFIVALSLAGLLAVEQIYRNAGSLKRTVATLVAVSFGTIFVFDFFVYSSAILSRGIDAQLWAARGFVNMLAVPVLILALKRDPDWQSGFFVSRQVVFYSASLVGVGGYLVLVAFGGVLMQQLGGSWGTALKSVFFVASLLVLALVFFSPALRRRFKVFVTTHFYANRYDYREEWLKLIRRLAQDSERAPMPELCLDALADIVESDGGVLWLRDEDSDGSYQSAAVFGYHPKLVFMPADHPLIRFMGETGWVVDGQEAVGDPEHYRGALDTLIGELVSDDRIFVPIVLDDELIGVAGLNRPPGMPALNFEDHDLLRTVGRQLAVFLEQSRVQRHLTQARQFEVFNKFSAFVMHDLKNLIAQQSLVVANARKFKSNPEFVEDAIGTIENSVKRMTRLLEQLETGRTGTTIRTVDLSGLLKRVCRAAADRKPIPRLVGAVDGQTLPMFGDADKLMAAINHLLRNAQDATGESGDIKVLLTPFSESASDSEDPPARPTHARIAITDTGAGMSEEFIEQHLFEPFYSTKGAQGMGIGVFQARDHVRSLGGRLTVISQPGAGTTFTLVLPLTESLKASPQD